MSEEKEVDIYRDTPVRLLGYANEVGEAFRALVHVRYLNEEREVECEMCSECEGLAWHFNWSQVLLTK